MGTGSQQKLKQLKGKLITIYKLSVRLENGQTFTFLPPENLSFPKTSGYDEDNLRVINIVGIQNGDFLKECPKRGRSKCSEEFGLRKTVNRAQSECTDCRGEY